MNVIENNESGFKVYFTPNRLSVLVIGIFFLGIISIDYLIYISKIVSYILKILELILFYYILYFSLDKFVIELTDKELLSYSAPFPALWGNKKIPRSEIKNIFIKKLTGKNRFSSANTYVYQKYTTYFLIVTVKDKRDIKFYFSDSYDDIYKLEEFIKKYLDLPE